MENVKLSPLKQLLTLCLGTSVFLLSGCTVTALSGGGRQGASDAASATDTSADARIVDNTNSMAQGSGEPLAFSSTGLDGGRLLRVVPINALLPLPSPLPAETLSGALVPVAPVLQDAGQALAPVAGPVADALAPATNALAPATAAVARLLPAGPQISLSPAQAAVALPAPNGMALQLRVTNNVLPAVAGGGQLSDLRNALSRPR